MKISTCHQDLWSSACSHSVATISRNWHPLGNDSKLQMYMLLALCRPSSQQSTMEPCGCCRLLEMRQARAWNEICGIPLSGPNVQPVAYYICCVLRKGHFSNILFTQCSNWSKHSPLSFAELCVKMMLLSQGHLHTSMLFAVEMWHLSPTRQTTPAPLDQQLFNVWARKITAQLHSICQINFFIMHHPHMLVQKFALCEPYCALFNAPWQRQNRKCDWLTP